MSNAIRCIDQRVVFKNSRISRLALIFNLKNPSTTVLYAKHSVADGKIRWFMYLFFFYNWYEPMAYWIRLVAESLVTSVRFRRSAETLGHFAWHWAHQCTDTRAFYIVARWAALYVFFVLDFVTGSGDLALKSCKSEHDHPTSTILENLKWGPGPTRPHVLAWHMGRDHSYCRASELTDRQISGFVYSLFLENTEKTKAS